MTPADLTPGTRVIVLSPDFLAGQTGVVIEMNANLLNRHDCAVEMDAATVGGNPSSRRWPLCFYAHELAVAK
jgi:hypothetical protein